MDFKLCYINFVFLWELVQFCSKSVYTQVNLVGEVHWTFTCHLNCSYWPSLCFKIFSFCEAEKKIYLPFTFIYAFDTWYYINFFSFSLGNELMTLEFFAPYYCLNNRCAFISCLQYTSIYFNCHRPFCFRLGYWRHCKVSL